MDSFKKIIIIIVISNNWDNLSALNLLGYLYLLFHITGETYNISLRSISEPSYAPSTSYKKRFLKGFLPGYLDKF